MGLDIFIAIEKQNGDMEELVYLRKINEIKSHMKNKVGIDTNTCKMITPKILSDIRDVLDKATLDRYNSLEYIDDTESQDYKIYEIYRDSLYLLNRAVEKVAETRKFGETIYYTSTN